MNNKLTKKYYSLSKVMSLIACAYAKGAADGMSDALKIMRTPGNESSNVQETVFLPPQEQAQAREE